MAPLFDDQNLRILWQAKEDIARLEKTLGLTQRNADRYHDVRQFLDIISKLRTTPVLMDRISTDAFFLQYIGRLERDLGQKPDEHEALEHPETELLLPEIRERIIVYSPSQLLLEQIRAQKITLHDIRWREFEEIVAELLRQNGYTVELGRGTKDGGKDIVAIKEVPGVGLVMSVWQAKKLQVGNKVDIHVIRELADTRFQTGASKGVIVTTTSLTKDALARIEQDRYLLHKVDGNDLDKWIQESKRQA